MSDKSQNHQEQEASPQLSPTHEVQNQGPVTDQASPLWGHSAPWPNQGPPSARPKFCPCKRPLATKPSSGWLGGRSPVAWPRGPFKDTFPLGRSRYGMVPLAKRSRR